MSLESGKMLLHYRLAEKIGEGGMGVVWRGADTSLGRDVAIKILPEGVARDPDRLARFEREARLLATLNHPHIASVYSVHESEGHRFLAMELVAGEDLAAHLRARGRIPWHEALTIASQIAEAIEAAHEKGVIHRDLKPANVQITPDGTVKVLDFGLAKALHPSTETGSDATKSPTITSLGTAVGVILGTAAYMSPEQARGRAVDGRTDIWALGCILFEMLSGDRPFAGETMTDLLGAIVHKEPEWDRLPPDVPAAARRLLRRCMNRDPKLRLRDAGDARILIDDILAGTPEAEATSAVATAAGASGRRVGLVAGGAAVVAAIIGFAAGALLRPTAPEAPVRRFNIPFLAADRAGGVSHNPAISPDGARVAYVDGGRIWVRDLDSLEPREIPGTEGGAGPAWSPDGKWIAFYRDQRAEKVSLAGGNPTLIGALPAGVSFGTSASNACWTDDGRIVIGTASQGLLQIPVSGGSVTPLVDVAEGESDFHEVACLGEGRGWAFVVHKADGTYDSFHAAAPDGTRREVVTFPGENLWELSWSPSGHLLFRRAGSAPGVWALPFDPVRLEATGDAFLVAGAGRLPTASADGTLVYMSGAAVRRGRLLRMSREGEMLGPLGDPLDMMYPFPRISPDGTRVLVTGGTIDAREIWTYEIATGLRRQISFLGDRLDMARWHPDGRSVVAYTATGFRMRSIALESALADTELGEGIMPLVTPGEHQLLYAVRKGTAWDWDIFVRGLDDPPDQARVLVEGPGVQWYPEISPDGRFLAYTSEESGRDEVFITTFPNPGRPWQISRDGGSFPMWRGDGEEIFFAHRDAILSVPLDPRTALPTGQPRVLFRRPMTDWASSWPDGYDVTPDGKTFIVAEDFREEGEKPPSIVVVQNWLREFAGGP